MTVRQVRQQSELFGCDTMLSLLLGCPNVMWTKKGQPLRRIAVIALLVLPVVALVVGWLWRGSGL